MSGLLVRLIGPPPGDPGDPDDALAAEPSGFAGEERSGDALP
jgi:hypothetical protein